MKIGFLTSTTRASVAGLIAAVVVVGTVWATTSASDENPGTTDTTVPVDSTVPTDQTVDPGPGATVEGLSTRIDELSDRIVALEGTVATMATALERAESTVSDLIVRVEAAEDKVARFAGKTSQLDTDGNYTGTIAPSQISPRLSAADIRGNWPLERTDGSLGLGRLVADGWGCSSDASSFAALVVGAFRGVECAKIRK